MKKNDIIEIGDVVFKFQGTMEETSGQHRELIDCYNKPSHIKELIWYEWENWFHTYSEDSNDTMWVGGFNCSFFTINAIITLNHEKYFLHITSTKNHIYKFS